MEEFATTVAQVADSNLLFRIIAAVIFIAAVGFASHLLVKAIQRLLSNASVSISQTSIVVNIVRIVVWGVAICFVADVCFNINMTAVVAALGVGGIAISLGFQNTLSNLFGGVQITLTRVVKPGDNIKVGTNQGVVQDVNWSYTTMRNANKETVIIPNSLIASNAVVHLPPPERVSVPLVASCDLSDTEGLAKSIQDAALAAAKRCAGVVENPVVVFNKVTHEGLFGTIVLTIDDGTKAVAVSDEITRSVAPIVQKAPHNN
jgi:small-conductance mechanosensitive channel